MIYLIVALIVLGIVAALTTLHHGSTPDTPAPPAQASCGTCTGNDSKCEQECMMEAATREIEYFDDEELDRFKGRQADAYTPDEIEEFANVLYTMPTHEVAAWNRSLILRGINIPNALKDELIMLIDEK